MKKPEPPMEPNARFAHLMRWFGELNLSHTGGATLLVSKEMEREAGVLIDSGRLDYLARNEQGRTVMGELIKAFKAEGQDIGKVLLGKCQHLLVRMLDQGCNPLLCVEEELDELLSQAGLRNKLVLVAGGLEAKGHGLRDARGGNLYHAMAKLDPAHLAVEVTAIGEPRSPAAAKKARIAQRKDWLTQVREDGNTPMHVLWEPATLDYNLFKPHGFDVGQYENLLTGVNVLITKTIVDLGGDVLIPNAAGESVWDMMNARDLAKSGILGNVAGDLFSSALMEIRAGVEVRNLERDTPVATRVKKSGMRL